MEKFVTYDMLLVYGFFVWVVFMIVEFIKEVGYMKVIKTKYVAFGVAALMMILVYTVSFGGNHFTYEFLFYLFRQIPLILINSILVTFASNGASDFNNPVDKTKKQR